MDKFTRRYIFIDFENLKRVKLKKLQKVCDKVFILVNADEEQIPFTLVQQIQKFGKGAKWVPVPQDGDYSLNYHLAFIMGKVHQKVSLDIEFAILSNDESYDPLVNFINSEGRSCLRVKRKRTPDEKLDDFDQAIGKSEPPFIYQSDVPGSADETERSRVVTDTFVDPELIQETANDTRERLKRSGNRPSELGMLRSYILLHNQELSKNGNVDRIINRMEETEDIRIEEGAVIYNF